MTISRTDPFTGKTGGQVNALEFCIQESAVNPLIQKSWDDSHPWMANHPYDSAFNVDSMSATLPHPAYAGYIDGTSKVSDLLADLSRSQAPVTRNFYWYGKGTPALLYGASGVGIKKRTVEAQLGNTSGGGCRGPQINHPYRLVFLDACQTGNGPGWANAFGIKDSLTYNDVQSHPEKAQAFVGWKGEVVSPAVASAFNDSYNLTLLAFFWLWQNGTPLTDCVYTCSHKSDLADYIENVLGYDAPDLLIPLGAPQNYLSSGGTKLGDATTFFGYPWITRLGAAPPQ